MLHLGEANEAGDRPSQRGLASRLATSQPSISRGLARLEARGEVRAHRASLTDPGSSERVYALTPSGLERLSRVRTGLRELRAPGTPVSVGDLELALSGSPLSELVAAVRAGASPEQVLAQHRPEDDLRTFSVPRSAGAGAPGEAPSPGLGAPPPLIGRVSERLRLAQAVRRLREPGAGGEVVILVGPAGGGKSRLLQFAEDLARREHIRVVAGHALAGPVLPFSPFEEMLGPHARTRGAGPATSVAGREPSPGPGSRPRGPGRTGVSRVRRMLDYLARIDTMAGEGPLLLLVDDLERVSPAALQVFQFLATNVPRRAGPVLLLAASREESWLGQGGGASASNARGLLQVLDGLARSGSERLVLLPLRPLTPRESRVLLEVSLRGAPVLVGPPRRIREVVERANGNPLFLLEGGRALREKGAAAGPPGSTRSEVASPSNGPPQAPLLPPVVRRLLLSRLEGLPARERRVLEMAACLGEEEFEAAPVEALASEEGRPAPREVLPLLRALTDRWRILRPVGPGRFAFVHGLFLEVLQEAGARRRNWSARLAAWWERERPRDPFMVARLYLAAGDAERGLPWIDNAIEDVLDRQAFENVEVLVRGAHELLRQHPSELPARAIREVELATRLWVQGATSAAQGVLEIVLATDLPRRLRWGVEASLLNTMATLDPGRARARFEALRAEVEDASGRVDDLLSGQLLAVEAFLHLQAGRWEESRLRSEAALVHLARVDDWVWTTWSKVTRGTALLSMGRWKEALRSCQADRARFRGDRYGPFRALLDNVEGRVHMAMGAPEKARRCFAEGLRAARRFGNASVMASLLANRAAAELLLEDPVAARASIEAVQDLATKFDLTLHAAWARYRWAQWLHGQHRPTEAARAFHEAHAAFLRLGLEGPALLPEVYRACRELQTGDRRAAREALDRLRRELSTADADERVLLPPEAGLRPPTPVAAPAEAERTRRSPAPAVPR